MELQKVQEIVDMCFKKDTFIVKENDGFLILDKKTWYIKIGEGYSFDVSTKEECLTPFEERKFGFEIDFKLVDEVYKSVDFLWFVYQKYRGLNDE